MSHQVDPEALTFQETGREGAEHPGEQAVQEHAHEGGPGWGSPMFGAEIPHGFQPFLRAQRMLTLAATDHEGRVWATTVSGSPGFAGAVDDRTLFIDALPAPGDPLREVFEEQRDLGLLALQPQTRRRVRMNGVARRDGERLVLRTEQVLGNCPKYIQTREITAVDQSAPAGTAVVAEELTADQHGWIERADTFFIASRSPGHGADASHRGGMPGFVRAGTRRLRWPDYTGNQFYMTLGNLQLSPAAGLLFLDWEQGHTLQVTGTARIDWDPRSAAAYPGALRMVEFDISGVVQIDRASPLRWSRPQYSRFNPPAAA
ncbi:pyridoxamine 5'-phosphate oxidase family protein [Kineosporia sp. NBRC 101731]|uniref:pyridoxamine 5'-phosphate oxidase family protein n=1 Tax=Kineosporia sp. NBRC 101731 TaxID=3032199 RepID=UPI00249FF874|nr:pyridoxamine 5'-phosphate oxidase family protein [Kineosporia sp. NBRC 101731]GLY29827.1 oxidoreductase [Kineosporia sp. NBRC 101731]